MKVVKFGGSSVATAQQILKIVDIVKADPERRIVVVSAPGKRHGDDIKVTDLLIALAEAVLAHKPYTEELAAVGIASFGPLDPDPRSPTFGFVTTTPKPHWAQTDFAGRLHRQLAVPIGFDTDVNIAALGEHRWGAAQNLDTFIYLTVGTGIGGGGMVNGALIHGLMHPEMGHIRIPHDLSRDPFEGCCPYHGDCLEGLASGPALEGRWHARGETLPEEWDVEDQRAVGRLRLGEEIEEEGAQPVALQPFRHPAIARAMPTAPAAVGEHDCAPGACGHGELSGQIPDPDVHGPIVPASPPSRSRDRLPK